MVALRVAPMVPEIAAPAERASAAGAEKAVTKSDDGARNSRPRASHPTKPFALLARLD
ncbi:MAG: hypothetical protein PPHEINF_2251 [uncultured Paraburkholderia sp.]|nr:MAG: hypothetical protein PPHEINF_2251 [uncultured Paraburkholderia sp.]CAH2786592.1 MAG: hypothetical protein PPHEESC_2203 [uncultured Paraburkholderia sp.]CAH2920937.1 MAG: hypothetical protein PPHERAN_2130 [uncultured Paraburkholderia sp.]CAH2921729.1 MAG: hypothetical protein PPHEMADMSA_2270 [uncultured Paraburkholderia sp.]